ncbi:MAG: hypothetical protein KKB37_14100, partial [Alphaproteobacteria bacterium]|nr:hypothetical protein [Alphaproteobacteria bacterium]
QDTNRLIVHDKAGEVLVIRKADIVFVENAPADSAPQCKARILLATKNKDEPDTVLLVRETPATIVESLGAGTHAGQGA